MQQAEDLDPPGPLHDANEGRSRRSQLRANGLRGLRTTFQRGDGRDASRAGRQLLAAQMQRLHASDVVWADLFQAPGASRARRRGHRGTCRSRRSEFVPTDDLIDPGALAAVWRRDPGRRDRRHSDRPARKPDHVREGASERSALSTTTETTIQALDAARVRGGRRGLGRQPGGPDQGDADDPEAARADRARP